MRLSFFDVILNFMEDIFVGIETVTVIVDVTFLCLAGPRLSGDHVEVSISGFFEFFITLKGMSFEAVSAPGEQLEHVGVFLSVFGGLAEYVLGEVDGAGRFWDLFLARWTLHLEIL